MNVGYEIKSERNVVARHSGKLSFPGAIIGVTCVQVAAGLATFAAYLVSKNETWIRVYFDYLGALFFVVFGAAGVWSVAPRSATVLC